jgi:hypothetical protein
MSGNVVDKATAFRNEVTGSTTNKIVCKASNHDLAGPKKKHVDYLINMTNDPHCSMATLADYLVERLKNTSWVVVFKDLITTHNLMTLGNEKFLQCVATRANSFTVDSFTDRTDSLAMEMSVFVRRYAKYLGSMCTAYKTLALDLCRLPKGDQTPFRSQDPVKVWCGLGCGPTGWGVGLLCDGESSWLSIGLPETRVQWNSYTVDTLGPAYFVHISQVKNAIGMVETCALFASKRANLVV